MEGVKSLSVVPNPFAKNPAEMGSSHCRIIRNEERDSWWQTSSADTTITSTRVWHTTNCTMHTLKKRRLKSSSAELFSSVCSPPNLIYVVVCWKMYPEKKQWLTLCYLQVFHKLFSPLWNEQLSGMWVRS